VSASNDTHNHKHSSAGSAGSAGSRKDNTRRRNTYGRENIETRASTQCLGSNDRAAAFPAT